MKNEALSLLRRAESPTKQSKRNKTMNEKSYYIYIITNLTSSGKIYMKNCYDLFGLLRRFTPRMTAPQSLGF
jgi:hypothetical protein